MPYYRLALAAACSFFAVSSVEARVGTYEIVVQTGDMSATGEVVDANFQGVVINSGGDIAFRAQAPGDANFSVFSVTDSVLASRLVPGQLFDGVGIIRSAQFPYLTDDGLIGGIITTDAAKAAVYVSPVDNGVFYKDGDFLPNGTSLRADGPNQWQIGTMNSIGEISLRGWTTEAVSRQSYAFAARDNVIENRIANGDAIAGVDQPFDGDGSSGRFSASQLTDDGLLYARSSGGLIVAAGSSVITPIVSSSGPARVGRDGNVVFRATLTSNGTTPQSGYWTRDGSSFRRVLRSDAVIIGERAGATPRTVGSSSVFAVATSDVFTLTNPTDTILVSEGQARLVARDQQSIPGISGVVLTSQVNRVLGDGTVIFQATMRRGNDNERSLIYFHDEVGHLEVMTEDTAVAGINVDEYGFYDSGDFAQRGVNGSGEIVFEFRGRAPDNTRRDGIMKWTAPSLDDLIPADANLDGVVNLADFGILRSNFGSDLAYRTSGDFNGDNVVNLADFGILRSSFGNASASDIATMDAWAATVPEPAAGLAALGVVGLLGLRRRSA
ncbi:MAG: hypothetical protein AAF561_04175 [Planctomycetota bacterium]